MNAQELNEALMISIEGCDVNGVEECLLKGADPNFKRDESFFAGMSAYNHQPYSPLRLVMFILSNSLNEDKDFKSLAGIAKLLLKHGADPKPAMEIAESRYGKYDPTSSGLFSEVWHIVAKAAKK